ncbi:MAG: response regulator, partial [Chitinivibrionales bacterium]|nr:response regulator [Chitinivibrionales bacterium]MBD3357804.1 response regulator [Chitinivibrionales bacterium]
MGRGLGWQLSVSSSNTIRATLPLKAGSTKEHRFRCSSLKRSGRNNRIMERRRILVVDDDTSMLGAITEVLKRSNYELDACSNGADALVAFKSKPFDLVVSDVKMPGMSGLELLEKIRGLDTEVPFVIITAFGDVKTAVEAMKKGAYDYLEKDAGTLLSELELTVERTLRYGSLLKENRQLKQALRKRWTYIGSTPKMREIRELVKTVAASRSTVLVSGESGTGKELI